MWCILPISTFIHGMNVASNFSTALNKVLLIYFRLLVNIHFWCLNFSEVSWVFVAFQLQKLLNLDQNRNFKLKSIIDSCFSDCSFLSVLLDFFQTSSFYQNFTETVPVSELAFECRLFSDSNWSSLSLPALLNLAALLLKILKAKSVSKIVFFSFQGKW